MSRLYRASRRNLPLSDRFATIDTGLWLTKHRTLPRAAVPTSVARRVLSKFFAFGPDAARSDEAWADHTRIHIDAGQCEALLVDRDGDERGGCESGSNHPSPRCGGARADHSDVGLNEETTATGLDSPLGRYIQSQFDAKPFASFLEILAGLDADGSNKILPASASLIVGAMMKRRVDADPFLEWHLVLYDVAAHAPLLQHASHVHTLAESAEEEALPSTTAEAEIEPPFIQSISTDTTMPYGSPPTSILRCAHSCRHTLVRLNAPTSCVSVASIAQLANVKYLCVTSENSWHDGTKEERIAAREAAAASRCRPIELNLTVDVPEVLAVVTGLFSEKLEDAVLELAHFNGDDDPAETKEALSEFDKAATFVGSQTQRAYPVLHQLCFSYDNPQRTGDETPAKAITLLRALVERSPRLESFESRGLPIGAEPDLLFDLSQKPLLFGFASDISPRCLFEGCRVPDGRHSRDMTRPFRHLRQLTFDGKVDAGELLKLLFLDTMQMPQQPLHRRAVDDRRASRNLDEVGDHASFVTGARGPKNTPIGAQIDLLSVSTMLNVDNQVWTRIPDACPSLTDLCVLSADGGSPDALLEVASGSLDLKRIAVPLPDPPALAASAFVAFSSTLMSARFFAASGVELTTPLMLRALMQLPASVRSVQFLASDTALDAPSAHAIDALFSRLPKLFDIVVTGQPADLGGWAAVWPVTAQIRFCYGPMEFHLPTETGTQDM